MSWRDAAARALAGIKAYHGSPHSFDKFDASKIGTGEGAQVYGHGLYFAENPKVAHAYAENLGTPTVGGVPFDPKTNPEHYATDFWHNTAQGMGLSREEVAKMMEDDLGHMRRLSLRGDSKRIPFYEQLVDIFRSGRDIPGFDPNPGHRYEVNIKADPVQFLDWDKSLSRQPQVMQALQESSALPVNPQWSGGETYGDWVNYARGSRDNNAKAYVSDRMAEAGIPGIKYLDQFSRPGPGGMTSAGMKLDVPPKTSNYVVFPGNTDLVDIMRKYGVVGAPAGALGMGALADQSQYEAPP